MVSEMGQLRDELKVSMDACDLVRREMSCLTVRLSEKEAALQLLKKQSMEQNQIQKQTLQDKDALIEQLKMGLEEKKNVIEDVFGAMQAEETSRKSIQRNLEMTNERNRQLQSQLMGTRASLEHAVSDAVTAKDAYAVMREKVRMITVMITVTKTVAKIKGVSKAYACVSLCFGQLGHNIVIWYGHWLSYPLSLNSITKHKIRDACDHTHALLYS